MSLSKKLASAVICMTLILQAVCLPGLTVSAQESLSNEIQNGDFETPKESELTTFVDESNDDIKWKTTAPDSEIEIANTNGISESNKNCYDVYHTNLASNGNQFAELNANVASTLYQDISVCEGQKLYWKLSHRGRAETDAMAVIIGPSQKNYKGTITRLLKDGYMYAVDYIKSTNQTLEYGSQNEYTVYATDFDILMNGLNYHSYFSKTKSKHYSNEFKITLLKSNNTMWNDYGGEYIVPDVTDDERYNETSSRFAFVSVSQATNQDSVGNLIDNIRFSSEIPKESTPQPKTDTNKNVIYNLNPLTEYKFTADSKTVNLTTDKNGEVEIQDFFKEQTLSVVKIGQNFGNFTTIDSDPGYTDVFYYYNINVAYTENSVVKSGATFNLKSSDKETKYLSTCSNAKEGDTVTINYPENYTGKAEVTSDDGKQVVVSDNKFVMPKNNVTITLSLVDKYVQGSFKYYTDYSLVEPWRIDLYTFGNDTNSDNTDVYVYKHNGAVDNITSLDVIKNGTKLNCTKEKNLAGKNLVGAYYSNDLYTFELDYHIYVVFTVKDSTTGQYKYSKVKDRQYTSFLNSTIDNNAKNIYGETKPQQAVDVCNSIINLFNTEISLGNTSHNYVKRGAEVRDSVIYGKPVCCNNDLFSQENTEIKSAEPWALGLCCNNENMNNADNYGVIVYNCCDNNLSSTEYSRNKVPSADYLLSRNTTRVYSLKDGNLDCDKNRMSAYFTKGVYVNSLDSDVVYCFFEEKDGVVYAQTPQYVNLLELTKNQSMQKASDSTLYSAMLDLYEKLVIYNK